MAKETKSAKTSFEGKKVKPQDKVKVVVTNSKFIDAGSVRSVHPLQAEKWIADGKAVEYKSEDQAKSLASKSNTGKKKDLEKDLKTDLENITGENL